VLFHLADSAFISPLTKTLTATDFTAAGGITSFADAAQAILDGKTYVNVHTSAHPTGEIRGHLGAATFKGVLLGGQEVPPSGSTASATITLALDAQQEQLAVQLDASGVTGTTLAHLHAATSGINGPVVFPLASGTFTTVQKTLTAADLKAAGSIAKFSDAVTALLGGGLYANIHTTAHSGGELRGQLGAITLRSVLSPAQELAKPASTATGAGVVTIDAARTQIAVQLSIANLANATMAHIHAGAVGTNGPVILPLAGAFTQSLTKTVTAADLMAHPEAGVATFDDAINALLTGRAYLNVHSSTNATTAMGEIRGQVGPVTLQASLTGAQETPPVSSTASGSGTITVDGLQQTLTVALSETGLTDITMAHIHGGATGVAGPVIFGLAMGTFGSPLAKTLGAADFMPAPAIGLNQLSDAINAILTQGAYFNIHTVLNKGGEIRGQITP
jgi:hypothetical protein